MFIVKNKIFFICISLLLVIASFGLMAKYGIKKGIDFAGGTVAEIAYTGEMPVLDISSFAKANIKIYSTGTSSYKLISNEQYEKVGVVMASLLNSDGKHPFVAHNVNTVGGTLGKEMTQKAAIALSCVILAMLLFIAYAFREVSYPVSSWKYGVIAMITMAHDIIIPTGFYVLLSQKYGAEVDTLFVIALLTIMAITISDKIVVFDRIRENLKTKKDSFEKIIGMSLKQTVVRSINTSLTIVLSLIALYVWGPESTKFFALTLIAGIIVGTYSSICVASPLLTYFVKGKK